MIDVQLRAWFARQSEPVLGRRWALGLRLESAAALSR